MKGKNKNPKTIFQKLFIAAELISSLLDKGWYWNSVFRGVQKAPGAKTAAAFSQFGKQNKFKFAEKQQQ